MTLTLTLRSCLGIFAALLFAFAPDSSRAVSTVVFGDNFNREGDTTIGSTVGPGTGTWDETQTNFTPQPNGDLLISNNLVLVDHNVGDSVYGLGVETTGFLSPWQNTLKDNPGKVTWTLNMQSSLDNLSGFISSGGVPLNGIGFALVSNGPTIGSTQGYGLFWGGTGTVDPLVMVSFSGFVSTPIFAASTAPFSDLGTNYLSIRVEYEPTTDEWTIFGRNDGATAFSDPAVNTGYVELGSVVNADHTSIPMSNVGMFGSYNSDGASNLYRYDNIAISVESPQPGDYNDDGLVDAADYVRWRDGALDPPHVSGDPLDYETWKQNFGAGNGGVGTGASLVPEPATWVLALAMLLSVRFLRNSART